MKSEKCPNSEFFLVCVFLYLEQKKLLILDTFHAVCVKVKARVIFCTITLGHGHQFFLSLYLKLRAKFPYLEFFWSVFSRILIEYGEILHISPYSVQTRKNTDQKSSEYGQFSRSVSDPVRNKFCKIDNNVFD